MAHFWSRVHSVAGRLWRYSYAARGPARILGISNLFQVEKGM
jgi:hypothetical protein